MSGQVTPESIRQAARLIRGRVMRTRSLCSYVFSEACGADVFLKPENMQPTGSFKVRGAGVKLAGLDEKTRKAGVIAASAGNHAQGVAWHARELGIPAVVVMPMGTPFVKVARTEAMRAKVVLHGASLDEAQAKAHELAAERGLAFIHPYDDSDIIAGQGTIGLEMLEDNPDLDCLIVPVGGGGLIAGIATAAKAIRPEIEIVGVQASLYPSMADVLAGKPATSGGRTVAEGIAVKTPGAITRKIIADLVADILLVGEDEMEKAIHDLLTRQNLVVEGAGAAPVAALYARRSRFAGRKIGLVLSGGNIDSRLLASILMRGLMREGRMARMRIELDDSPGTLARVAGVIGDGGGNIVEIHHRRLFHDVPVKMTEIDAVVETLDAAHVQRLMESLRQAGFPARLLGSTAISDPG